MKRAVTIWSITFVSAVLPMLVWYTFDALVHSNCDPLIGCFGRIKIGAFVLGLYAFISSLSVLAAYTAVNKSVDLEFTNATIVTTAAVGLVLGIFAGVVLPNFGDSLIGMVVIWLAISFVIGGIAYLVLRNITITST